MRARLALPAVVAAAALALLLAAAPSASAAVRVQRVMNGLSSPVYVTSPPRDPRLFIVEKCGIVRIDKGGHLLRPAFLNISRLVSCSGEEGLLSIAFDPNFRQNRIFYVDYNNRNGDTRVARFRVMRLHPNRANPNTRAIVVKVNQPAFNNHKGGQLQFGPDGKLYISLGDGGSEGDPNDVGQSGGPLSSILRLDVRKPGATYRVYAYGLRNPWRFSFDRLTGDMWIGDVGQDTTEEIDHLKAGTLAGTNFGWSYYEGTHVFKTQPINRSHLKFPVVQYAHSVSSGPSNCAVMGGYVYRGRVLNRLKGQYVYADNCSGRVWRRSIHGGAPVLMRISFRVPNIVSFGQGSRGGLYLVSLNGSIYRLVH